MPNRIHPLITLKRRKALWLIGSAVASGCVTLRSPKSASQALSDVAFGSEFLGLNIGTELNWTNWRDPLIRLFEDANIQWLRVWYNWDSLESESGVYGDDLTLSSLQLAKQLGFKVLFVVWGTPSFAASGGGSENSKLGAVPDLDALRNYCRWLKDNLSEYVDAWEIGNEPNLTKYFDGSPEQYVETLATAFRVLRGRDHRVVAAGPSGASTPEYWDKLLDNGLERYCDRVNLHPYRDEPEDVIRMVDQFRDRVSKPLWITELGRSSEDGGERAKANFLNEVLPPLTERAEKVFWYRSIQGDGMHPLQFGLIEADKRSRDVNPLPAYSALADQIRRLSQ